MDIKRWIALFTALTLCLCLCACSFSIPHSQTDSINDGEVDNEAADNGDIENGDTDRLIDGITLNADKIRASTEIVELTTGNWREHFKVYYFSYSYDEETTETNTFGDIVSSEVVTKSHEGYAFGAGNERYHWYDDVAIELQNKETGELTVCEFSHYDHPDDLYLSEEFDLDNYECTRIKGSIYYFNLPMGSLPVATDLYVMDDAMAYPDTWRVAPGTNAVKYVGMEWLY